MPEPCVEQLVDEERRGIVAPLMAFTDDAEYTMTNLTSSRT